LFITRACRADSAQKIAVLKIRHPEGKPAAVTMDNSRELASLLRRANRLTILQNPPVLELLTVNPGEELPPSPWRLNLVIEPKRTGGRASST
jgi:hypothetical protein